MKHVKSPFIHYNMFSTFSDTFSGKRRSIIAASKGMRHVKSLSYIINMHLQGLHQCHPSTGISSLKILLSPVPH
ncbi:hypothetical protein EUGRSUZ_B03597 [Eucalyptus grandis]|uniref:Uncharacterized protein n=2 Tax=Eucalyptus grandis TaxID=71139 RepID=A0ACC3LYI3_EUCGR|nr:hypothetical protein EUGRSUZ_B03597 [Eucalyptus grandis]